MKKRIRAIRDKFFSDAGGIELVGCATPARGRIHFEPALKTQSVKKRYNL